MSNWSGFSNRRRQRGKGHFKVPRLEPSRASEFIAALGKLSYHGAVIDLLRSLFAHQAWADSAILSSLQAYPESAHDERIIRSLHHIVTVQRFFLSRFLDCPFDAEKELKVPESFDPLIPLFRETHQEELAFVNGLNEESLARVTEVPTMAWPLTLGDCLTQVAMHSQNHRGQCLTRMRENGAKPPALDYILWLKDRPAPIWAAVPEPASAQA